MTTESRRGSPALVVGLVLGITLVAVEALGVAAALPVVADDLDGRALFGATSSAFLLAQVVGIAVTGHLADRSDLAAVYGTGLALFAAGLTIAAAAPAMAVLVGGRVVQGLGAGAISTLAIVAVNRGWEEADRPPVMVWMSFAWVAPALVTPVAAGWLADHVSWRWVFAGILPLVPIVAALVLRPLRALSAGDPRPVGGASVRGPLLNGLALAAGIVALQAGLGWERRAAGVPLALAGAVLVLVGLRRLVPIATTLATVVGAATITKALTGAGFFGADIFLPLAVSDVYGYSATVAGLSLTFTSLTWTIGSIVQARRTGVWTDVFMARSGLALLVVGVAGIVPMLHQLWPLAATWAIWAIAAIGMGLAYNTLNLSAMAATEPGREGETGTALAVADIVGAAIATGVAGAVLAGGDRAGWPSSTSLTWTYALFGAAVVGAFVTAGHLRRDRTAATAISSGFAAAPARGWRLARTGRRTARPAPARPER